MDTELALRLADIESKFAFQEQLLSELNDVVAAQDQAIGNLERQLQLLARGNTSESTGADGAPGQEPPPPHY